MVNQTFFLKNEQETLNFGNRLAKVCTNTTVIYLYGDLGTGKTTFSRGFLQFFGYYGKVKSPTYTLIELYDMKNVTICHIDLYRITNPKELEFIGIYDYFTESTICLIEWPEKGVNIIPNPDIEIHINYQMQGRKVHIVTISTLGNSILTYFNKKS